MDVQQYCSSSVPCLSSLVLNHTFPSIDCIGGTASIEVVLEIDGFSASTGGDYQVYGAGVSIIPLIFVLLMALTTHLVELSLFGGVWLGASIITGSLVDGFRDTVSVYILDALNDWGHVAVILFTVFLSGTVGMMQKSGGMLGFTRDIAKVATTPRSGQAACFFVGVIIFFDDYSNVLLAGETMRPLLDLLNVSREKLSYVVDATSGPIASISPYVRVLMMCWKLTFFTWYCAHSFLILFW
jgi:Na+/H+ antiporter NhaC